MPSKKKLRQPCDLPYAIWWPPPANVRLICWSASKRASLTVYPVLPHCPVHQTLASLALLQGLLHHVDGRPVLKAEDQSSLACTSVLRHSFT